MEELLKNKFMIKILVIDDEPGIAELLSDELGLQGYTVVTAPDGEKGLELIRKQKFQLVITDIKMPNLDGIQVLYEIKRIDPSIEVIIITGYGTITTAVDAMKHGAYDFIQKPLNINEITLLVEKAIERIEMKAMLDIYEASMSIISAVKLEDLLPVLTELSMKVLKADDVSIMIENENKELTFLALRGIENDGEGKEIRLNLSRQYYAEVKEKNKSVLADEFPGDVTAALKNKIESVMICPLTEKGRVSGMLFAARTLNKTKFIEADLFHASIFATQISRSLDNAKLYKKLENKIDELNQAYAQLLTVQSNPVSRGKLEVVGRLFSDIAHKLNNGLSVVIGLSDILLENENEKDKKKDLLYIKTQAQECSKIVTDIITASKAIDNREKR
jgi:YesN/AraC family two-component response regulator